MSPKSITILENVAPHTDAEVFLERPNILQSLKKHLRNRWASKTQALPILAHALSLSLRNVSIKKAVLEILLAVAKKTDRTAKRLREAGFEQPVRELKREFDNGMSYGADGYADPETLRETARAVLDTLTKA